MTKPWIRGLLSFVVNRARLAEHVICKFRRQVRTTMFLVSSLSKRQAC